MKKEQQIFTVINDKNVPVNNTVLDTLEQEEMIESIVRGYIRETLLTEAAKGPQNLPDGVFVEIVSDSHGMTVTYSDYPEGPIGADRPDIPVGDIMLETLPPGQSLGPCGGAWMIGSAQATKGWGPMLYDVAMEYATMKGGGIIADRGSVSGEARHVWNYYMNNRGDVTGIQLDDLKNTLTPEEEDNCDQLVATSTSAPAFGSEKSVKTNWIDSPLSKRWTKPPTTIEALRSAGKLIWPEGGAYAPTKDLDKEGMVEI